jgi:sigma-B regulation protein RsbU (phosphoserine phosphatase)
MSKKPKIRSFSKRLTRWIALTQLIVMGLAAYWIFILSKNFVLMEEASNHKGSLSTVNAKVERILSDVSTATSNRVSEIEENLAHPDKLAEIMSEVIALNPTIRSCGISFVENYYPQKGRWFCPYAVRNEDGKIEKRIIGDASHDYLKDEWFTEALKADSSYWSKPFFDASDSISPLVSYMIPIHNKQGETVAILGADLSLNSIRERLFSNLQSEKDSVRVKVSRKPDGDYSDGNLINIDWRGVTEKFIIDDNGTFIAHHEKDYIIKKNYFDLAKTTTDTIDDHVGHLMIAGKTGAYSDKNGILIKSFKSFDNNMWPVYMFYEPVANTTWSIASVVPVIMVDTLGIGSGVIMVILIAIALLVTRFVGRFVIKRATKPLKQLAASADEVAAGNFNAALPYIKHNDEVRLLRDSFEGMQHSLRRYIDELKTTTASKAAIEKELKVAHDIQMSMLPKTFPPYPERDDIDIYGTLTPAKDVGGDLFDFYIRNEKLFFCIGDVSGKGVPASLVMAMTRSLFRNISSHLWEPDQIARGLNDTMAEGNDTNMFVTLFIGVLDLHTGHLSYCNAGHDSPLLIGSGISQLPCDSNLPVGVMPDWVYTRQEMQLQSQDTIFLYTDGLNEAENVEHAQFGDNRIVSVAEACLAERQVQPATLVDRMTEAVHRFVDEAEQSDDLTMLAIKFHKQST